MLVKRGIPISKIDFIVPVNMPVAATQAASLIKCTTRKDQVLPCEPDPAQQMNVTCWWKANFD